MPKKNPSDVSCDVGAHLAAEVLANISTVEPRGETMELDYYCELRDYAGRAFHVQAKGSVDPTYGPTTISSLPVSRKTVEEYWLRQVYPVYILMADVRNHRVFGLRITKDVYESGISATYTFRIPLSNELTAENIGRLMPDILANQPTMTSEEARELGEQFQQKNPLLCHDLHQIDAFLEIMRGSDQSAQVNAKIAIQTLVKSGQMDSHRLESGLIEIFRNCKDRITQNHVLDTLVAIEASNAGPEVIKQIDRNTRTYEYRSLSPDDRHVHMDFLFHGLARLRPTHLIEEVRNLIAHPDQVVLRGTLWLIGELKLRGLGDQILALLNSPNSAIRDEAARVIAFLDQKAMKAELTRILANSSSPAQLAAVITSLAQSQCFEEEKYVVTFLLHTAPEVRMAAAEYLGASGNSDHFQRLINSLLDEEPEVRQSAHNGLGRLTGVSAATKEAALRNLLRETWSSGKRAQAATVMGELWNCAEEGSRQLLVEIFRRADGISENCSYYDEYGNVRLTFPINLKTQALDILGRGNVDDLVDDIIGGLVASGTDSLGIYLRVIAEKKLIGAFEAIHGLSPELVAEWAGEVLATAQTLDPDRAFAWAKAEVMKTQDSRVFFGFCHILHHRGIDLSSTPGFVDRLRALFSHAENRLMSEFYDLVRRYKVTDVSNLIAGDLSLIPSR